VITYCGIWWLPSTPENRTHGTLSWDGGGNPHLEVDGQLTLTRQPASSEDDVIEEYHTILGRSFAGEDISCYKCLGAGSEIVLGRGAAESERFTVRGGALVGAHHADDSDVRYSTYALSITHLESWYPWVGLQDEPPMINPDGSLLRWGIAYTYPADLVQTAFGRANLKVSPRFSVAGPRRRREMRERLTITLTYPEAVSPRMFKPTKQRRLGS
jgi:ApeA N-terminal domain 1